MITKVKLRKSNVYKYKIKKKYEAHPFGRIKRLKDYRNKSSLQITKSIESIHSKIKTATADRITYLSYENNRDSRII